MTVLLQASYRGSKASTLANLRKSHLAGWFFVYKLEITILLNDLKKIRLKKRVLWLDEVRLTQSHIRFI